MSDVEETIAVPKQATEAMTKAATAFAMQSCITSSYSWPVYMSDLWAVMVANAPATSPVCVEVRELEWEYPEYGFAASTPFGVYKVIGGDSISYPSLARLNDAPIYEGTEDEEAQQACQADVERRTLELVNARSVESVRAETVEQCAKALEAESKNHDMHTRAVLIAAAHTVRSLTEGEG